RFALPKVTVGKAARGVFLPDPPAVSKCVKRSVGDAKPLIRVFTFSPAAEGFFNVVSCFMTFSPLSRRFGWRAHGRTPCLLRCFRPPPRLPTPLEEKREKKNWNPPQKKFGSE